jgi:hypothetical protein
MSRVTTPQGYKVQQSQWYATKHHHGYNACTHDNFKAEQHHSQQTPLKELNNQQYLILMHNCTPNTDPQKHPHPMN